MSRLLQAIKSIGWGYSIRTKKINKDAIITDQLQEGQTLKDLALYTVTVTGYTTQVRALKEQLVLNEDYSYTYDPDTKKVTITLLKETSETLAVFLATEASEEVFTYKILLH